ncbi:MAG: fumarylacetoacetate hydrolase family protein [Trueperaceae bacterium]
MFSSQQRFSVRRVFCVERNYAAHAREMRRDPDREPPFFQTASIPYPTETTNYHYEAELVLAMGKTGQRISAAKAHDYIFGYAVGLDMTRRDLQLTSREQGRPWIREKCRGKLPIGAIYPAAQVPEIETGSLELRLNGEVKQSSSLDKMIWSNAEIIEHVSRYYTLQPGDLIFTGTPEGVGAVNPGDKLEVSITGLEPLHVKIA